MGQEITDEAIDAAIDAVDAGEARAQGIDLRGIAQSVIVGKIIKLAATFGRGVLEILYKALKALLEGAEGEPTDDE